MFRPTCQSRSLSRPDAPSLYFHNALGRVLLHAGAGYVRIEWQAAPMASQELRAVYEHTLHLLRREGLTRVLTDHRHMLPYTAADRDWLTTQWVPRAVTEAGYRRCAIVQAHAVLNQLATKHMVQELSSAPLELQHFAEPEPAMAWLLAD